MQQQQLDEAQSKLDQLKESLEYGPHPDNLPVFDETDIQRLTDQGRSVIIIHNLVHDCTEWIPKHPGGPTIIQKFAKLSAKDNKDMSKAFDGQVYNHSNAARNLLSHMRIARTTDYVVENY